MQVFSGDSAAVLTLCGPVGDMHPGKVHPAPFLPVGIRLYLRARAIVSLLYQLWLSGGRGTATKPPPAEHSCGQFIGSVRN
jgi:hypothetical protein